MDWTGWIEAWGEPAVLACCGLVLGVGFGFIAGATFGGSAWGCAAEMAHAVPPPTSRSATAPDAMPMVSLRLRSALERASRRLGEYPVSLIGTSVPRQNVC